MKSQSNFISTVKDQFYVGSLVLAGLGAGALMPRSLWAHYLGSFVGQLGYEVLFLKVGPLFFLGAVFLLGYSVIYLAAAALAAYPSSIVSGVGGGSRETSSYPDVQQGTPFSNGISNCERSGCPK